MVNEKGVGVLTIVLIAVAVVVIGGLIIANWSKLTGHASAGEACTQDSDCDSGVCMDGVCLDAASAEAVLAGKLTSTGTHATKTTGTKATRVTKGWGVKATFNCTDNPADINASANLILNLVDINSDGTETKPLKTGIFNQSYNDVCSGKYINYNYSCKLDSKVIYIKGVSVSSFSRFPNTIANAQDSISINSVPYPMDVKATMLNSELVLINCENYGVGSICVLINNIASCSIPLPPYICPDFYDCTATNLVGESCCYLKNGVNYQTECTINSWGGAISCDPDCNGYGNGKICKIV